MQTYISFSKNRIIVICGNADKNSIEVDKIVPYTFQQACIMNGTITDPETFVKEISDFWTRHNLPTRQVSISLEGNHVKLKKVQTPQKAKIDEKYEIIKKDFAESSQENNLISFVEVANNGRDYYGFSADEGYLTEIIDTFAKAGIEVTKIVHNRAGLFRLIDYMPQVKKSNCILSSFDNDMLTSLVIERGVIVNTSSTRLFGERGTESFGAEISRNISQLLQFQITTRTENPATKGFFVGFSPEDVQVIKDQLTALSISYAELEKSPMMLYRKGDPLAFFENIGVLALNNKEENLLFKHTKNNEELNKYKNIALKLFPLVVVLVLCIIGTVVASVRVNVLENKKENLNTYLTTAENVEKLEQYNKYLEEMIVINDKISISNEFKKSLESYPLAISKLGETIQSCGADIVSSEITSFTSINGKLLFTTVGTKASEFNKFVEALENTGVFFNVTYSGYMLSYDGSYTVNIECVLATDAGK